MRCVWTYWDAPPHKSYRTDREHKMSMMLSLLLALKHGYECVLYTTESGAEFFSGFPFHAILPLPSMNGVRKEYWSYPKIAVYAEQSKPFVHIDSDVYLIEPIPIQMLSSELIFQNKEVCKREPGYGIMNKEFASWPIKSPFYYNNLRITYNFGVAGGCNLAFFQRLKGMADMMLFNDKNKKHESVLKFRYAANFFIEQYFGGCLVKFYGLQNKTSVVVSDLKKTKSLVHLWGATKRDPVNMARLEARLKRDYSDYLATL